MTDRLKGCTVVFEKPIREDDAEHILGAIRCLRGVLKVKPVIGGTEDMFAEERARQRLGQELWQVLYPSGEDS